MFRHIDQFAYKRTLVQAIGFYLFFQFASLIAIAIIFALLALLPTHTGNNLRLGLVVSVVATPVLTLSVLYAKGRMQNIALLVGVVLATVLAYYSGSGLSYVVPALYTMLPSQT